ncbi:DUF3151 domain-containing protein [Corynebacterium sp. MNWGS58]|uniref:DUF3151 domain-containing protein n=1 Tax=Corynebacterium sp. 102791.4 TaxID=3104612 RepID=UPI003518F066
MEMKDMLAPEPIKLPADPAQEQDLQAAETALNFPESPLVWAFRAEETLKMVSENEAESVSSLWASQATAEGLSRNEAKLIAYSCARTGYHRGLDCLRANGWKGWGPVPFSHEPNQGVLRAIAALALASQAIGDDDEYDRCRQMLSDADPGSVEKLLG